MFRGVRNQDLQCFSTIGAVHIPVVGNETLVDQGAVTFLTLEAFAVPLAIFIGYNLCPSKAGHRLVTSTTFFGDEVAVTVDTVEKILMGSELLATQLFATCLTHKALSVPGFIAVGQSSTGNGLSAVDTMLRKLLLVAGSAVDVITLWNKASCSNFLQAATAGEAAFVPVRAAILKTLCPWFDGSLTAVTCGAVGPRQTLGAGDPVVLESEGIIGQGAAAVITAETVFVPVMATVV